VSLATGDVRTGSGETERDGPVDASFRRLLAALTTLFLVSLALRAASTGPGTKALGNGHAAAFSPVKERIIELHDLVLVIVTLITLFVGGLLLWVMYRYNATRNPEPSRVSHNTILEVAWTVIPVLILVVIAIPSFA